MFLTQNFASCRGKQRDGHIGQGKLTKKGAKKTKLYQILSTISSLKEWAFKWDNDFNWDSSLLLQIHNLGHLYPPLHLPLHTGPTDIISAIKCPQIFLIPSFLSNWNFWKTTTMTAITMHSKNNNDYVSYDSWVWWGQNVRIRSIQIHLTVEGLVLSHSEWFLRAKYSGTCVKQSISKYIDDYSSATHIWVAEQFFAFQCSF